MKGPIISNLFDGQGVATRGVYVETQYPSEISNNLFQNYNGNGAYAIWGNTAVDLMIRKNRIEAVVASHGIRLTGTVRARILQNSFKKVDFRNVLQDGSATDLRVAADRSGGTSVFTPSAFRRLSSRYTPADCMSYLGVAQ
jgi:hypothetical protein